MNELIKVEVNEKQEPIVCARDLYEHLEIKDNYTDWFKRMIEYGFAEGQDFIGFYRESTGGRPSVDHHITIDMAKELCMIQRNERGKQARQYFIAVEKEYNSPEKLMARALQVSNKVLLEYKHKLQLMQPKAEFHDAVVGSSDTIDMGQVAKVLNCGIGRNKLFEILREKKVLRENNEPFQKYCDRGWFRMVESKYQLPNGDTRINIKTVVFQKGVDGIRKILKGA